MFLKKNFQEDRPSSYRGPNSHPTTFQPNSPLLPQLQFAGPRHLLQPGVDEKWLDDTLDISFTPTADPIATPPAPVPTASEPAHLEARESNLKYIVVIHILIY